VLEQIGSKKADWIQKKRRKSTQLEKKEAQKEKVGEDA
jgi:hypothetical protein